VRGGYQKCAQNFIRKPEDKRLLGTPLRRWVSNIKIGLREIGFGGVNWIYRNYEMVRWLAGSELYDSIKDEEFLTS
jgi:hypothetical protein